MTPTTTGVYRLLLPSAHARRRFSVLAWVVR